MIIDDIFLFFAPIKDCGYSIESPRRGVSDEYSQSMFFRHNQKNNVYPCNPNFSLYKVEVL